MADSAFDNLLEPVFQDFKIPYHVHKTSSKTSHKEFLKDLVLSNSKENIIVIFGGDTLLFDVLNSLPKNPHIVEGPQITLCPVPCGTGNALATSLGITTIPIGISKTLGVAKSASDLVRLPILRITISESGREQVIYAAVVCSWGLHASLVADSDEPEMRRQYGPQRFQVQVLPERANLRWLLKDCSIQNHMYITAQSKLTGFPPTPKNIHIS